MSSPQIVPWLRCRHLLQEYGDNIDDILCDYQTDILQIVGGIGTILKEFLKQKPQNMSCVLLNNLWNLLSSTKQETLAYDPTSLLTLSDDVLASICTFLNLNDLNNLNQVCYITSIAVRMPHSHKLAVNQINSINHNLLKQYSKQIILSPYQSQQYDAISSFQSILNEDNKNVYHSLQNSINSAINIGIVSHLTQCVCVTTTAHKNKYDHHFRFSAAQFLCDLLSVESIYFHKILNIEIMQRFDEIIREKKEENQHIIGIIVKQIDCLIIEDCTLLINCNILSFIYEWIALYCLVETEKYEYEYEHYIINIMATLIVAAKKDVVTHILTNKKSIFILFKLLNIVNCRSRHNTRSVYYKKVRDYLLNFLLHLIKTCTSTQTHGAVMDANCIEYILSVIHELNRTDRDMQDMNTLALSLQFINSILLSDDVEIINQLMIWCYSKQIRQYINRETVGCYVLLSFALMLRYSEFIDEILDINSLNGTKGTKGLMDEIIDIIICGRYVNNVKNGALCIFNIVEYGNNKHLQILYENHGVMAALFGLMDTESQHDQQLMINALHCIDVLLETQVMKTGSHYSQKNYKRKLQNLQYQFIDDNKDNLFVITDSLKSCIQKLSQKYDT